MIRYIYSLYNVVLQVITWLLLTYLQTYVNGLFIPDKYLWDGNRKREHPLAMAIVIDAALVLIEACLLIMLWLFINKRYLNSFKVDNAQVIYKRTMIIVLVLNLIALGFIMFTF
jgi:hypothetical protein